jgi:DNA-binding NarL/FixJ family response regulator
LLVDAAVTADYLTLQGSWGRQGRPEDHVPMVKIPRVVVADDHQSLLDRVVSILAGEFSVVGTAKDGPGLVEAEAELTPDVLVIDISMPGMSGLEATSCIRRRGSRAAVVCLTAHQEPEIVEAAWRAGALGYVAKAALARDLVPAVRAALEGRRFLSASAVNPEPSHT